MNNKGKVLNIGYINSIVHQEWAFLPWKGAVNCARKHGVNLYTFCGNMINSSFAYEKNGNIIYDIAANFSLDGLIIWTGELVSNINYKTIEDFIEKFSKPKVIIGPFNDLPTIKNSDYKNMKIVVEHFIKVHGFKRIAYIGIVPSESGGFVSRHKAYKDALIEHGIAYDESIVKSWNQWDSLSDESGINGQLDTWLKEAESSGIEAIIGSCDPTANWVIDHLHKLHIKVPEDIAVAGYDGFLLGMSAIPRLTTIRPAWEELASLAIDNIVKIINGQVSEKISYTSSRLIISQSCGCIEDNVRMAGENISDKTDIKDFVEKYFEGYDNELLSDIMELVDIVKRKIDFNSINIFLQKFKDVILDYSRKNRSVIPWYNIISYIQSYATDKENDIEKIKNIMSFCSKAMVIIGNTIDNDYIRNKICMIEFINTEHSIIKDLTSVFDIDKITDLIADRFPKLGIRGCYLSLYENPKPYSFPDHAPEYSRLILAYDENGRADMEKDGVRFLTCNLIPEKIKCNSIADNYISFPLYFQDNQIGFVVFIASNDILDGNTYSILANQMSSSLRGAMLLKEITDVDIRLKKSLNDLQKNHLDLENAHKLLKENQNKLLISEKMVSLGRLTAGIAHEMNTPLAAIRSSMHELSNLIYEYKSSQNEPQVTKEDLSGIIDDMSVFIDLANKTIEKSLNFIKGIKRQAVEIGENSEETFFLKDIINELLLMTKHKMMTNNINVIFQDNDLKIKLKGTPGSLLQALINLIMNAFDAMNDKNEGEIRINLSENENYVIICIIDQGSGIHESIKTKIFDPMFTTKPFGESSGLGLTIVQEVVKGDYNGYIEVESVIYSGTAFKLYLKKNVF